MRRLVAICLLGLALLASGCGSENGDAPPASPAETGPGTTEKRTDYGY